MNGKDLFAALNHVEDAFVAEAEAYTARKVIPLHTVRWVGALAACICLLLGWAVAVQLMPFGGLGEVARDTTTAETVTEGAMNGAVTEEAAPEEVKTEEAESETAAETETGTGAENAEDTEAEEKAETEETAKYVILADAFPMFRSEEEILYAATLNGTFLLDEELKKTVEQCALTQMDGVPRFLVAFDLYRDGQRIDPESAEYAEEIARLEALGYTFRTLAVQHRDKSVKVRVCGLLSEGQLEQFAATKDYGYFLYFPENEDGTPLDWENTAELCGLPTAEDASVTKD